MAESVVIAGGGVGGLATALAFARAGHPVTVLEQDELPISGSATEAFMAERRGAPQVHQTHGFLARIVVVIRERFPDVLAALLDAGVTTLPGVATLGDPQPGDEDLNVLIVRRTTFEWVLRQAAVNESGVDIRTGVSCTGLHMGDHHTVDGVETDQGLVTGDIVVASTGRRGDVPGWLGHHGLLIPETIRESGLMYMSRWYQLPASETVDLDPKLGGDLGFVKYLAVPGDGDTLSVTLAIRPDDKELRQALSDPDRFDAACRSLPGPEQFFRGRHPAPIGGVRPMGGLLNRLRRFTDDSGNPAVLGFHAVGDAHTCTNPLYGRGCSLAMVMATLLADTAAAHPGDATERARAYEAGCAREVQPWYEASLEMDKQGADPAGFSGAGAAGPGGNRMAAVFAAAATDPVLGRGFARFWNLLGTPAELMSDGALLTRIATIIGDPETYPVPDVEGPTRRELLAALAA